MAQTYNYYFQLAKVLRTGEWVFFVVPQAGLPAGEKAHVIHINYDDEWLAIKDERNLAELAPLIDLGGILYRKYQSLGSATRGVQKMLQDVLDRGVLGDRPCLNPPRGRSGQPSEQLVYDLACAIEMSFPAQGSVAEANLNRFLENARVQR